MHIIGIQIIHFALPRTLPSTPRTPSKCVVSCWSLISIFQSLQVSLWPLNRISWVLWPGAHLSAADHRGVVGVARFGSPVQPFQHWSASPSPCWTFGTYWIGCLSPWAFQFVCCIHIPCSRSACYNPAPPTRVLVCSPCILVFLLSMRSSSPRIPVSWFWRSCTYHLFRGVGAQIATSLIDVFLFAVERIVDAQWVDCFWSQNLATEHGTVVPDARVWFSFILVGFRSWSFHSSVELWSTRGACCSLAFCSGRRGIASRFIESCSPAH